MKTALLSGASASTCQVASEVSARTYVRSVVSDWLALSFLDYRDTAFIFKAHHTVF